MNVSEARKNPCRRDEYPVTDPRRAGDLWAAFRSRGSPWGDLNRSSRREESASHCGRCGKAWSWSRYVNFHGKWDFGGLALSLTSEFLDEIFCAANKNSTSKNPILFRDAREIQHPTSDNSAAPAPVQRTRRWRGNPTADTAIVTHGTASPRLFASRVGQAWSPWCPVFRGNPVFPFTVSPLPVGPREGESGIDALLKPGK
ncbi:hypothetical protein WN48_08881 [Eufriesea mexicana]|uniref:Uncharacterized protein n=1 Tax=Eufriesea mexicana TaxID=516756 RepID=A0A310SSA7_9HYME|nr:hypothetical protein WN48_08881 [Eufriesea mexicana]